MVVVKRLAVQAPEGTVFELPASEVDALYPTGVWRPLDVEADVTLVTYGAMTEIVEAAAAECFDEDEVVAEHVVVCQLAPLRIDPIVESVTVTSTTELLIPSTLMPSVGTFKVGKPGRMIWLR